MLRLLTTQLRRTLPEPLKCDRWQLREPSTGLVPGDLSSIPFGHPVLQAEPCDQSWHKALWSALACKDRNLADERLGSEARAEKAPRTPRQSTPASTHHRWERQALCCFVCTSIPRLQTPRCQAFFQQYLGVLRPPSIRRSTTRKTRKRHASGTSMAATFKRHKEFETKVKIDVSRKSKVYSTWTEKSSTALHTIRTGFHANALSCCGMPKKLATSGPFTISQILRRQEVEKKAEKHLLTECPSLLAETY